MKKINIYLFIIISCFITFSSCKKKSELVKSEVSADEKLRFSSVISNTLDFNTLQSKINIKLNAGSTSQSVSGTIKIIRNEKLQISIAPIFGIELAKIEISNDSIKIVDRINKRYLVESISEYREALPVDIRFETIQSLLLNNIFIPGKEQLSEKDFSSFSWRTESDGQVFGKVKNQKLFNLDFALNRDNELTRTSVSTNKGENNLDWKYSQFQPFNGIYFPYKSEINYSDKKNKCDIVIGYSKIELDNNINLNFNIPSSYKKIDFADIFKSLTK
ncbi:MAG: DUF4292 domain-containing protein [Bacteroidales bacterium]|nr:DUF4292 domain-containing protein [Bacteroidales bacterium]